MSLQSRAHSKVSQAVAAGRLCRPDHCSHCHAIGRRIEAHHEDYAFPLDVVWLCPSCHRRAHGAPRLRSNRVVVLRERRRIARLASATHKRMARVITESGDHTVS